MNLLTLLGTTLIVVGIAIFNVGITNFGKEVKAETDEIIRVALVDWARSQSLLGQAISEVMSVPETPTEINVQGRVVGIRHGNN